MRRTYTRKADHAAEQAGMLTRPTNRRKWIFHSDLEAVRSSSVLEKSRARPKLETKSSLSCAPIQCYVNVDDLFDLILRNRWSMSSFDLEIRNQRMRLDCGVSGPVWLRFGCSTGHDPGTKNHRLATSTGDRSPAAHFAFHQHASKTRQHLLP